jgi:hypothetical protein
MLPETRPATAHSSANINAESGIMLYANAKSGIAPFTSRTLIIGLTLNEAT